MFSDNCILKKIAGKQCNGEITFPHPPKHFTGFHSSYDKFQFDVVVDMDSIDFYNPLKLKCENRIFIMSGETQFEFPLSWYRMHHKTKTIVMRSDCGYDYILKNMLGFDPYVNCVVPCLVEITNGRIFCYM